MTHIKNYEKVSSYIRKYITKDMPQFKGKKRYWCSLNLMRPFVTMHSHYLVNPFVELSTKNKIHENQHLNIYRIPNNINTINNFRGIYGR